MLKIDDLFTDLSDGIHLINLLEIISDKKIPGYNKKPKIRHQRLENNSFALNFLKKEGIKLVAIGPEDIVDQNGKLILGLIWTIILRYQIQKGDGAGSAKQELLEWVRRQIPECDVQNFHSSWQDGKAICHLADAMQRGIIPDLAAVDKNPNALANATLGEDTAERELGIPKILQPEDMVCQTPDELSVMTYISFYRDYLDNLAKRRSREQQERIAVPEKTIAFGAGLTEGEQFVPAEFTIQAKNCFGTDVPCGGETFDVDIKSTVKGAKVPADVKDNQNGTYTVTYTPTDPGRHVIAVNLHGKPISGSPFNVPISKTSVSASGPGLEKGEQYLPSQFTIHANKLHEKGVAPDALSFAVQITAPKLTVLPAVTDNKDGTYTVTYTPLEPGRHVVAVSLYDKPIANGPFSVAVDKTLVLAKGPGLEKAEQFIPAEFTIEALNYVNSGNSSGPSDFNINISGPQPVEPPFVKDNGDGTFGVTYTAKAPGRYNISISLKGQPISNGPFSVNVNKTGCDVGPGLESGEQFIPTKFTVNATPLKNNGVHVDPSDIDVKVSGPNGAPLNPDIVDNNDGTFTVSFVPKDIGRYPVAVAIKGQPIANVSVPVAKTTISAYGPGLEKASQFVPAEFTISAKVLKDNDIDLADDEVVVKVVGPNGPLTPAIKKNDDGTYDVTYNPNDIGRHSIDVTVKGVPIANKSVPVGKSGVNASGEGLDKAEQYIPSSFNIDARDLKDQGVTLSPTDFQPDLKSPNGQQVPLDITDNGDGTFTATYTPLEPGRHKLDIILRGAPILQNYAIPVAKSTTDPTKSTASGRGIEPGNVINQPTDFTIQARNKIGDPMKTGGDPFKVSIVGPYNSEVEPELRDNGDGTYFVTYEPTVAGPHRVEVTLNGTPISGSPWEFDVTRSDTDPDPAQFDVYGPGIEGGNTADPAVFTIVSKNSKGVPLTHGGAPVEVEVTEADQDPCPCQVVDNNDGTYTVSYQPSEPGTHRVDVMLRTKKPLFYDHIKDSPYYVPIVPGTDAANSLVYGPGLEEAYDTKPAVFYIKARDRFGNDMGRGGDPFEVQVTGPSGDIPVDVVDNDDGTYTVTYHPSEHGKHTIYANLKHNPVAKSPYTINIKEGADYQNTFIEKFQFSIRTKTKANQFKTVGGETFNITITGPQGPIPSEYIEIKDLNNGSYTVNYSLPAPGDYNISVKLNDHDIQGSAYPQGRPNGNY